MPVPSLLGVPSALSTPSSVITTWDPAHKAAGVTLSGGDLTAAYSSGSYGGVRATHSRSSGKWYWEINVTAGGGGNMTTGFGTSSWNVDNYVGSDSASYGWANLGGQIYNSAAPIATAATYGNNLLRFALDLANNRLWVAVGAGNWNNSGAADPATNTGGISIAAGAYFPAWAPEGAVLGQCTANFGASAFSYSAPSGFLAWNG